MRFVSIEWNVSVPIGHALSPNECQFTCASGFSYANVRARTDTITILNDQRNIYRRREEIAAQKAQTASNIEM